MRPMDGRWFVSCRVVAEAPTLEGGAEAVGVDLGPTHFATLSTGEKIANPRHPAKRQAKVSRLQRRLARKKKGSNNRREAKLVVARAMARVRNARADFLHALGTRSIRENQAVCAETPNVKGMLEAKLHPRAIADAGWGEFVRMVSYKAGWSSRRVVKVDR